MTTVFTTNLRTRPNRGLLQKLEALLLAAGLDDLPLKGSLVALKVHFGEPGNLAFLRPNYVAAVARMVKERGGIPFATDANTLYRGRRAHGVDHLTAAAENGFSLLPLGCPVVIADGLRGRDYREIPVPGGVHCGSAKIASAIAEADVLVSLNHVKGHEQTGFGGALKNLGMGCGSREGKLFMHSGSCPTVKARRCVGCGSCAAHCAFGAVTLGLDRVARIDEARCAGCGQCIVSCAFDAIQVVWAHSGAALGERIAEYAVAAVAGKPQLHVNFLLDISPNCDCWAFNDAPVTPNLGILASLDPVALDQASMDRILRAPCLPDSAVGDLPAEGRGTDPFSVVHPEVDWRPGLAHAERLGLGSRTYELRSLDEPGTV